MLVIRDEQQEVFKSAADALFEQRIMTYLRESHGDAEVRVLTGELSIAQIPDDLLLQMVKKGIAGAREYDMTWESSIMSFVVLMFVVAPNFDQHPVIRSILTNELFPPDSRMDQLWETTTDEHWEVIEQNYDINAWQPGFAETR